MTYRAFLRPPDVDIRRFVWRTENRFWMGQNVRAASFAALSVQQVQSARGQGWKKSIVGKYAKNRYEVKFEILKLAGDRNLLEKEEDI